MGGGGGDWVLCSEDKEDVEKGVVNVWGGGWNWVLCSEDKGGGGRGGAHCMVVELGDVI